MYDPLKDTLKKKQKIVLCIRDSYDIPNAPFPNLFAVTVNIHSNLFAVNNTTFTSKCR